MESNIMIAEMPATLSHVQQSLQVRVNNLRSLQRIVMLPEFEVAYETCSTKQRRIVLGYINSGDKDAVQQWLSLLERDGTDIEELPVRELRRLAASLGIVGYQGMSKSSLLSYIRAGELK
jgi:hypothetical protein